MSCVIDLNPYLLSCPGSSARVGLNHTLQLFVLLNIFSVVLLCVFCFAFTLLMLIYMS